MDNPDKPLIYLIVGARPNFMKAAPLIRALEERAPEIKSLLVHTGQHYDYEMSKAFFEDLDMPDPDIYLGVGSGTHAEQTAKIMISLEKEIFDNRPDLIVVFGDVNSTLAASVVASKLMVPVAHVEAGLRSFDRTMPEEINRIVTDILSDLLFTTERDAIENLRREGIPDEKIHFTGNVMIDTLLTFADKARKSDITERLGLSDRNYAVLTLHRPSNVDVPEVFDGILEALAEVSKNIPVVFPVHPRTKKRLAEFGFLDKFSSAFKTPPAEGGILLIDPVKYTEFLALEMKSLFVLTDSGGIQEETTFLGVPCLTLRNNTERPVTLEVGTNILVGTDPHRIIEESAKILRGEGKKGAIPELWDGKASHRIAKIIKTKMEEQK
ncbi:MAG: UDP-N-acetylglucosamine 2-epimerase (non-hydrolyzing) [Candidatus Hydrothermota bacterium]|nr:MAG: UDP-N-acetylglucosamine 2-epimerase (non-hydrolyzing) [Candidatus Hydrothermae bacterium]